MLSVIIATLDSERSLVRTLAALVPGATAGLITEVVVADAGSRDEVPGKGIDDRAAVARGSRGDWPAVVGDAAVNEPVQASDLEDDRPALLAEGVPHGVVDQFRND